MKILVRARLFGQDRGQASAGLDGHHSLRNILVNLRNSIRQGKMGTEESGAGKPDVLPEPRQTDGSR